MAVTSRVSLDSLPFPVFEEERAELLRYKEEAIQKEREITTRKHEELKQLRRFVELRLSEIQTRKQLEELQKQRGALLSAGGTPFSDSGSGYQRLNQSSNTSFHVQSHSPSPMSAVHSRTVPQNPQLQSHSITLSPQLQSHSGVQHVQDVQNHPVKVTASKQTTPRRRLTWTSSPSNNEQRWHQFAEQRWHKVTAIAKGFLVRRLLQSHKAQGLVKTIKDTSTVLQSLTDGSSSSHDVELYKRLNLQVARLNLHKIFFETSVTQQMAYIAHSRLLREEKAYKEPPITPAFHRVSASHQPQHTITGKLSMATKKSMERRKQRTVGMPRRIVSRKTKTTQDSKH
ncbi:centriolar coiled-coil protein of 110 kDa-like isoform X2 [Dysidea avara]|uniref:centriolar coiled-coil protein of 110 kDa-like isoform X2 n=1 Tax=Dysidea avara TaxID=196820 RepID=UPI003322A27F